MRAPNSGLSTRYSGLTRFSQCSCPLQVQLEVPTALLNRYTVIPPRGFERDITAPYIRQHSLGSAFQRIPKTAAPCRLDQE